MEGRLLLELKEQMLDLEEEYLRKKKSLWDSKKEGMLGENEDFLGTKEELLRQTIEFWTKKNAFYRERDRRLEESLLELHGHALKSEVKLGLEEPGEQLLPGIADDITLNHISTKLSWRELHILSLASRGWLNAIRNHQVYGAKVRSHSTETFAVFLSFGGALALRSLKGNSWIQLPPISHLCGGIPMSSQCIALDGKIYVLGGAFNVLSDKVYVLDLAGQRSWALCASMQKPRRDFGCGVLDGKIYVFGGVAVRRDLCESEVYDPRENIWRPITPMPWPVCIGQVVQVRAALVIQGLKTDSREGCWPPMAEELLEVYHPLTDDWTKIATFQNMLYPVFGRHGKLHQIHFGDIPGGIFVHDFEENFWTRLNNSDSIVALDGPSDFTEFSPHLFSTFGDELLAIGDLYGNRRERLCVLRSIQCNSEKEVIKWREERDWLPHGSSWLSHQGGIRSIFSIEL